MEQKTDNKSLKLALIQFAIGNSYEKNIEHAILKVEEAAENGAELIALPELFASQYFCKSHSSANFALAETVSGPTFQRFSKLAKDKSLTILLPIFEKRATGIYHNSAIIVGDDGEIKLLYRKSHIPDDPCYHEKFYFTEGEIDYPVIKVKGVEVGVLICWDQWFPESFRLLTLKGAKLILIPTAIGWVDGDDEHRQRQLEGWQIVQRGHAVANGIFIAAINRVGHEYDEVAKRGIKFWGSSFVTGPFGELIKVGSESKSETLIVDIDSESVESTRINWPFLRDRRLELIEPLKHRYLDETK
ncbi:MAG: carbon-nitrogen hydrolase [Nitrospinota bacterium]